jgi:hypothetical protein
MEMHRSVKLCRLLHRPGPSSWYVKRYVKKSVYCDCSSAQRKYLAGIELSSVQNAEYSSAQRNSKWGRELWLTGFIRGGRSCVRSRLKSGCRREPPGKVLKEASQVGCGSASARSPRGGERQEPVSWSRYRRDSDNRPRSCSARRAVVLVFGVSRREVEVSSEVSRGHESAGARCPTPEGAEILFG